LLYSYVLPPGVWTGIVRGIRLGLTLEEGGLAMKRSQYTDQQVAFALGGSRYFVIGAGGLYTFKAELRRATELTPTPVKPR
jgi:hypothetical protein